MRERGAPAFCEPAGRLRLLTTLEVAQDRVRKNMNLNKVILVGRVTRDPEMRTIPSGQNVANFSLATNRVWNKDGQKQTAVEFHNIIAWARLAEIVNQYAKKGALLMVEGRLQTRTWQGQDGTNKNRTEIIAENIQLGPRAGQSSESGNYSSAYTKASADKPAVAETIQDKVPTINLDEAGNPIEESDSKESNSVSENVDTDSPETVMPF